MSRRSSVSTADESLVPHTPRTEPWISSLGITSASLGIAAGCGVFIAWPFPTTVPVFVALVVGAGVWCLGAWVRVFGGKAQGVGKEEGYRILPQDAVEGEKPGGKGRGREKGVWAWVPLGLVTGLLLVLVCVGVVPPAREMPLGAGEEGKVFIAANLYNVQGIWEPWRDQVIKLIEHRTSPAFPSLESSQNSFPLRRVSTVGKDETYLSIYESNSSDNTPQLLTALSTDLTTRGIRHRIISEQTGGRSWPHGASEARIAYLAAARNRALEPLSSPDREVRLEAAWARGRVVFLNDVVFEAGQVVTLLGSRVEGMEEGYDVACGMDFGWSGESSPGSFSGVLCADSL